MFCSDDHLTLPEAHGQLQNFLEGCIVAVSQHRSHQTILNVAPNLCEDQRDEQAATAFAKSIIDSGRNQDEVYYSGVQSGAGIASLGYSTQWRINDITTRVQ